MFYRFTLRVQDQSSVSIDRNFLKFSRESQKRKTFRSRDGKKTFHAGPSTQALKTIAASTDSSYYFVNAPGPLRGILHQVRLHIAWLSKR
jgi:hypothetical protein